MKFSLFLLSLFVYNSLYAQSKDPVEITPALKQSFRNEIRIELTSFKSNLKSQQLSELEEEFTIDTFLVERFMQKWIDADYTDIGMSEAGYEGARIYDSLLNKYYKKLMTVLEGEDKKTLQEAQKAWITFRDAENKLGQTISKEQYAGGGTMQSLTESSTWLELVRNRTITLFEHYRRAIQDF